MRSFKSMVYDHPHVVLGLNRKDINNLMSHIHLGIIIRDPNILVKFSFCEPAQPIKFKTGTVEYDIFLSFEDVSFLTGGNFLIIQHLTGKKVLIFVVFFAETDEQLAVKLTFGWTSSQRKIIDVNEIE